MVDHLPEIRGAPKALLIDGVDRQGRPTRLYVSSAQRVASRDDATLLVGGIPFRMSPGATVTIQKFGDARKVGRPSRAWFVAVAAAGAAKRAGRLSAAHGVINEYRQRLRKDPLADPRARPKEKVYYREAARWVKAAKAFSRTVAREGFVEVTVRDGVVEVYVVRDGKRQSANALLTGGSTQALAGRQRRKPNDR